MLDSRKFIVKERLGLMKLTDTYDLFDLASGAQVGLAHEVVSPAIKLARILIGKRLLPATVEVKVSDLSPPVLTIKRGPAFLRPVVSVLDQTGKLMGKFRGKLFSVGGAFDVLDAHDTLIAEVKGDWKGWNFTFRKAGSGAEVGKITKTWAGLGKEMFTTADNYVIALDDSAPLERDSVALLLAAGLAVDTVLKEK
jgi:uncharacterized protein YxjI